MTKDNLGVSPRVIVQFLGRTLPFKTLAPPSLEKLSRRCLIDYYPRGTMILEQDVTDVAFLYLVQKGGVRVFWKEREDEERLKEMCGEGAAFGALSLFRGQKSDVCVQAHEDTFCFLLEKEAFLELVEKNSRLAQFFLQNFSEDFTLQAYTELRSDRLKLREQGALQLFNSKVRALVKDAPVMISEQATIREAGVRMDTFGIGSLLVKDSAGNVSGIVTDQDLRNKVVAQGMDYQTPVEKIMTTPVYTVPANVLCFEALLEFVKKGVDHLVVELNGQFLGVVTARDVMIYQGTWPIYLFREIAAQKRIEGLYDLSRRIPMAIRTMIEEGARAYSVSRVITLIGDSILKRLLDLLIEELGPPPVPFCWLALGVDGRREQTLRLEPDSAFMYQDPGNKIEQLEAEAYFECLTAEADSHLRACGYPAALDQVTVSNPCWRKPYCVWNDYFEHWISSPDPMEVAGSRVFLDFRTSYGMEPLANALRKSCITRIQQQPMFLAHLAADCLANQPPLSFYGNVLIDRVGGRKHRFDLQKQCLTPFADVARLLALREGIEETNTISRLELLSQIGKISMDLGADAREAYEFVVQLNLIHQLRLIERGSDPESYVNAEDLSDLERKTLKESFSVISSLLNLVRREFRFLV